MMAGVFQSKSVMVVGVFHQHYDGRGTVLWLWKGTWCYKCWWSWEITSHSGNYYMSIWVLVITIEGIIVWVFEYWPLWSESISRLYINFYLTSNILQNFVNILVRYLSMPYSCILYLLMHYYRVILVYDILFVEVL